MTKLSGWLRYCFPIRKIFSEIFDFKPANFQKWSGKIRLGANKACDVKSGTEVILLVSICYKSLLFRAAHERKYECKMPSHCVVFGCSNTPDPKGSIILHKIPYYGNSRLDAIKRRKRGVDFVKRKHAKLEPSSSSWMCSKHLEAGCICSPSKFREQTYILWLKKKMKSVFHRSQHCSLQAKATIQEMTKKTARTLRRKVRLLRQTSYKAKLHI